MKKKFALLGFILTFVLFGCAPKGQPSDSDVQKTSGPFIEKGYYSLENPLDQPVPAIAIQVEDGITSVYGMLSFTCNSESFSIYGITSQIFTDHSVTEAHGPMYSWNNDQCVIHTQIEADSASTIKLTLTIDGVPQKPYILKSLSKLYFVETLKKVISQVGKFKGSNADCQDSFGLSCDTLRD
jgi:hypothetical protein